MCTCRKRSISAMCNIRSLPDFISSLLVSSLLDGFASCTLTYSLWKVKSWELDSHEFAQSSDSMSLAVSVWFFRSFLISHCDLETASNSQQHTQKCTGTR